MKGKRSTILYLHQRAPDVALEALNRLTGLRFAYWPESLINQSDMQPDGATQVASVNLQRVSKQVSG
ncbi:hypothetical protein NAU58_03090 [Pseudomonas stutzeri]|uniref:Uncharacterized protein n=1 Tax=Stutzerimonas stutzeri TaxID=316 RepID=A0A2N8S6K8_STUST|nr:hypothetical protein [Stutzerimonas stutzeri]MCQ4294556.1 hypothetical protein [Stutzerimonas stutzeri]PNF82260.1 hypothetical protein CXK92_01995 [Stutzerimonas stutzeri]